MTTRGHLAVGGVLLWTLVGCSEDPKVSGSNIDDGTTPAPSALVVDTPAAASWLPLGPVVVSGSATSAERVLLDGTEIQTETSGAFSESVVLERGISTITVLAEGLDGIDHTVQRGVIAGVFADPAAAIDDGLTVRLNQGGIDELEAFVEDFIDPALLAGALAKANPVSTYELFTGTWIQADIVGLTFGAPDIVVTPVAGALELQVTLPTLVVDLNIYGEALWIDYAETLQMTAERAVMTATLAVGAEDGTLTAELLDPEVTLADFAYDASILPDLVEDYLFVDTIRTTIEDTVVEQAQALVPALLEETLAGLDFSFSTTLLGRELSIAASFARVAVDTRGLEIGVDVDVVVPGEGSKSYAGVLSSDGAAAPSTDITSELALTMADDLLNRILFEVWRGGVLDLQLSTTDGSLDPTLLDGFPLDAVTLTADARLPPVAVQGPGDEITLQMAELVLDVDTPDASIGDRLVVKVSGEVAAALVVEEGALGLALGDVELRLEVLESDWSLSDADIVHLVDTLITPEVLSGLVGDLRFVLPSLYGLAFASAEVTRPATGLHTAVEVDLEIADK